MPQKPTPSPLNPKCKHKHHFSSLIRLTEISANSDNHMYTIQAFQIEPQSLTHQQVTQMIDNWGAFDKIRQKFFVWEFSFQYQKILNIVPENFYTTAIHYVFMKKLSLLIKDFDHNQVLKKSLQLKEIYKIQSLSGKLKGKRFDYLLLVTVKLISFFLGAHTHQIIINSKLQAEIYAILVYVLLGTQVGQRTYLSILQRYKQKPVIKFKGRSQTDKHSIMLPNMSKHSSQHRQTPMKNTNRSKKRIGRTQCRTGTALFHQLDQQQEQQKIIEMRQLVKANLAVKEFVSKPKPKQTLDEVLAIAKDIVTQNDELTQAKTIEKKQMKHRVINYTQMSCSLDLNRSNQSLNAVHNYSLKIKPQKSSKYYQMIRKQDLKLTFLHEQPPIKLPKIQKPKQQVYSYQAMVKKKISSNYWKGIINQMKENKFENVQHFPPISAKMYFQHEEQQEERIVNNNNRVSETVDVKQSQRNKENHNMQAGHVEYLTQRIVQTPKHIRQTYHQLPTATKLSYKKPQPSSSKLKESVTILPSLQQLKNQINILQYSSSININQIYKNQKAFMNVYSSQPLDDLNQKLKKKSFHQLKDIEKRFKEECDKRREKIQHTYFR